MTLFSIIFSFKALPWRQKNFTILKAMAIFKRATFLIFRKKRNTLAIRSSEKKGRWLRKLTFFLPLYEKSKLLNPRSACYAWGKSITVSTRQT
jgi:hypothetical protein